MNADGLTSQKSSSSNTNKIAIVGMSCLFPGAPNLASFWSNIVHGVDAIRDVSAAEWSEDYHYREQPQSFEEIYCKKGGFITEHAEFDPLKFGVMPNSIEGFDPDQLLALQVAADAMADAGYAKNFDGKRAEVILGRTSAPGGGTMNMVQRGETIKEMITVIGQLNPDFSEEQLGRIKEGLLSSLRSCNSDTIPGQMPNILAGRIAGRLGFKGRSLVLDSACASSLIAVEIAVRDLLSNTCDVALAGGVHVNAFACFYEMFCGLGALSRKQKIRPFDNDADGTLLGEGLGMVVLKRLEQAIEDGDRIYATICGIGSSSDGQGTSMLAPSVEGEALAMTRAYEMAAVSPRTVTLLEGHGTGTPSGDAAELRAVETVFGKASKGSAWCAIGSIKSMIGHCQAASGVAGLIKVALSLYHRILPPTLNVKTPTREIDWDSSPCYVNSEARTWINPNIHSKVSTETRALLSKSGSSLRRGAVSAFGFGGVNAHAILEEVENPQEANQTSLLQKWETEVCLFKAGDEQSLLTLGSRVKDFLETEQPVELRDVSYTLNLMASLEGGNKGGTPLTLAIVATSCADLQKKLESTIASIKTKKEITTPDVYFAETPLKLSGKMAYVLPGLGAAYPNMLSELCLHLPDVRAIFDFVDELALDSHADAMPSKKIFPRSFGSAESSASLAAMDSAVVTVLMAEWALFTVLQNLEIEPDALLGCSTGEFAALNMGGAVDILSAAPMFYRLSTKVSQSVSKEQLAELRTIIIAADYDEIAPYLADVKELYLGAALSPYQTMLSGPKTAIKQATEILTAKEYEPQPLPMAIPYHTPLVAGMIDTRNKEIKELPLVSPVIPAWSCSTVSKYPNDPEKIRQITTELFTHPILLKKTVEAMYEDGVRIFVEVGPKGVLTPLISDILQDKPHAAIATNNAFDSAITQLNHCLAALAANGVPMNLDYLYRRRAPKKLDFQGTVVQERKKVKLNLAYPEIKLPQAVANNIVEQQRLKVLSQIESESNVKVIERTPTNFDGDHEIVGAEPVLTTYLSNMADFHQNLMHMQNQLMQGYMAAQQDQQPFDPTLPLIRNGLLNFTIDDCNACADINLSVETHQYLLDHAIGGEVNALESTRERVYLLPLTVALEMMSELASLLCPEKFVTRISLVRAVRRIRVSRTGCLVRVRALKLDDTTIDCSIDIFEDDASTIHAVGAMTCRVQFASNFSPSYMVPADVNEMRPPSLTPNRLYGIDSMFHGPRMQSVVNLEAVSKKVITGSVLARPATGWFENPEPKFVLDPLLLDNSTQLVLYHLFEHNEDVSALLPFLVDSIEFHTDLSSLRGTATVTAVMNSSTTRGTEADVYITDQSGFVLAKFNGITSRRIIINSAWKKIVFQPSLSFLSQELKEVAELIPGCHSGHFDLSVLPEDEPTLTWCLDYILATNERLIYQSLPNVVRKREWLGGRIAAKDAVRRHLSSAYGLQLTCADIVIYNQPNGQPIAAGDWQMFVQEPIHLSIAHKDQTAVAIAGNSAGAGLGIDLEEIAEKEDGFDKLALLPIESSYLQSVNPHYRDQIRIQIWAAKESVGKAWGIGMSSNPRSLSTTFMHWTESYANLCVQKVSGEPTPYIVHSFKMARYILSFTNLATAYTPTRKI